MKVRPSQYIEAGVFDESQLTEVGKWIKRLFAFALMGMAFMGTYVQLADGWRAPSDPLVLAMALGWQVVAFVAQFSLRRQWQSVWYIGAVGLSAVPSTLTYGALMVPEWRNLMTEAGAWAAVALIIIVADIIPEQILVRRSQPAQQGKR